MLVVEVDRHDLAAPRFSSSNDQNPSHVPTSSTRLPSSEAGRPYCGDVRAHVEEPVRRVPGSSSVWYQRSAFACARRSPWTVT